jgi:hypothetical protein
MICPHPDTLDNLSWLRDDRRLLGGSWRCRECSRLRAYARRQDLIASGASYWRYERGLMRGLQRLFYPTFGAGAHRWSEAQREAALVRIEERERFQMESHLEECRVLRRQGKSLPRLTWKAAS